MSGKTPQRFELATGGRTHRVEIVDGTLRRDVVWYVDDQRVAVTKSSDEKVQLKAGSGVDDVAGDDLGLVALLFTTLGRPRRVTWYEPADGAAALAAAGIGGIDLEPEPGSAAAKHEQRVRDHPRRYAAQHTAAGVLKVVLPMVLVYVLARAEIKRRRRQDELKAATPDEADGRAL